LEAANWRVEQAILPMVVTRNVWREHPIPNGAGTRSILLDIPQACLKGRQFSSLLDPLLCLY
jgi:hypothetical protein